MVHMDGIIELYMKRWKAKATSIPSAIVCKSYYTNQYVYHDLMNIQKTKRFCTVF